MSRDTIDPGKGYRRVAIGEVMREGDEFLVYPREWRTVSKVHVGCPVRNECSTVRRLIEPEETTFKVGDRVRVKSSEESDWYEDYGGQTGTVEGKSESVPGASRVKLETGEFEVFYDEFLEPAEKPFTLEPGKWYETMSWGTRRKASYVGPAQNGKHVLEDGWGVAGLIMVPRENIIGPWPDEPTDEEIAGMTRYLFENDLYVDKEIGGSIRVYRIRGDQAPISLREAYDVVTKHQIEQARRKLIRKEREENADA